MKKVFSTLILTFVSIMMFGALSFADNVNPNISVDDVRAISESFSSESSIITKPKDFTVVTIGDEIIISGVVKNNDVITFKQYTRVGEEYVPMGESIERTILGTGAFTQTISLRYETSGLAKESKLSKDTLIVLELKRSDIVTNDYRVIKSSDEKDLKETLDSLKVTGFTSYTSLPVASGAAAK